MASVNEVRLMGNLGADPDLRYTPSGAAVATLSLATSRSYQNKDGDTVEDVQWHRVVVWGKQAEAVAKHKKKGEQLYIAGYLVTRKYTDAEGIDRWSTEVVAERCLFTGRAPSNRPQHPADTHHDEPPRANYDDDDIPF